ncbi:MAG: VOC family protein [Bacteroidetes bacterium]|jgi:predicted enzyme related to lactoylglutathione lyase|nr:VOC family protein [Bacteroidota bacterium]
MAKVTGLGGIFFKSKIPEKIRDWYSEKLGLNTDKHGTNFEWRKSQNPEQKGFTVCGPFSDTTEYFKPSEKEYMINLRVDDLREMLNQLKGRGVEIIGEIDEYEYGLFAHIMDPEGTKIELWEPFDEKYDKIVEARTTS